MSDEQDEGRDTATPEETAVDHVEPSKEAETEFHPFDEVYDDFKPGPAVRVTGADGLPITVDQTQASDIPALSTTSLVCMGDFSKFVLRDDEWGEILVTLEPSEVERAPNGSWRANTELVTTRLRESGKRADLGAGVPWIAVQPIRPTCRHYVRQLGSFHLNAQHQKTYRLCAARRTTEGTFMTVSDSGMYACDMREPFDVESVKALDDFDVRKVQEGAHRVHLPLFQMASDAIVGDGTIFNPPKN